MLEGGAAAGAACGGGRGMGMAEVVIMDRSAASCESMCSVGSIGSNGSRNGDAVGGWGARCAGKGVEGVV